MIKVILTTNLQKYFPQAQVELGGSNMIEILHQMDKIRPGFSTYILEDNKQVRKHVNIFVQGVLLPKTETNRELKDGYVVHIMQALSGG